jgi:Rieske Fe-S protein
VIAGRLLADEIDSISNDWAQPWRPQRMASIVKSAGSMLVHDLQINAQYNRFLQSDIAGIEDLANGEDGVLNNPKTRKPTAIYKDDEGKTHKFVALCPHMKSVACWNRMEKSWNCPAHGSRFSKDGVQLIGRAKGNLQPMDESGEVLQGQTAKV